MHDAGVSSQMRRPRGADAPTSVQRTDDAPHAVQGLGAATDSRSARLIGTGASQCVRGGWGGGPHGGQPAANKGHATRDAALCGRAPPCGKRACAHGKALGGQGRPALRRQRACWRGFGAFQFCGSCMGVMWVGCGACAAAQLCGKGKGVAARPLNARNASLCWRARPPATVAGNARAGNARA